MRITLEMFNADKRRKRKLQMPSDPREASEFNSLAELQRCRKKHLTAQQEHARAGYELEVATEELGNARRDVRRVSER